MIQNICIYHTPEMVVRLQAEADNMILIERGDPDYKTTGFLLLATYVFEGIGLWFVKDVDIVANQDEPTISSDKMTFKDIRPMTMEECQPFLRDSADERTQQRLLKIWQERQSKG